MNIRIKSSLRGLYKVLNPASLASIEQAQDNKLTMIGEGGREGEEGR